MKRIIAFALVTTLSLEFAMAGQQAVVSTIGESKTRHAVNTALELTLKIPYFFTVPKSTYLGLPPELTSLHQSKTEKMPLILV